MIHRAYDPAAEEAAAVEEPATEEAAPPAGTAQHDAGTAELAALKAETDKLQAELRRARDDAAKYRTRNEEEANAIVGAVQKALGLKPEDAASDPEALAAALETTTAENAGLKSELATIRLRQKFDDVAAAAGADPALTWAVLAADGRVSGIDVSSEGLTETLAELVGQAITENPKLKAGPGVPPSSGTDISGGTGTQTFTRDMIRNMTPDEIEENWKTIEAQMRSGKIS